MRNAQMFGPTVQGAKVWGRDEGLEVVVELVETEGVSFSVCRGLYCAKLLATMWIAEAMISPHAFAVWAAVELRGGVVI